MKKYTPANIVYNTDTDLYDIQVKNPLSVCWQITTKCNLNCKYCISNSGKNGEYGLDTQQALKIIKNLGELGINRLDFTGGEPLIRSDLGTLICCAKEYDINTIVTTNTTLLNKENIKDLKQADLIQISVDGPQKIHDEQRQAVSFNHVIENIKRLKEIGCKIRLNSFIYNSNKQYVDYLINLSKELGVFSHLFIMFTPQGRGRNHIEEIIPTEELEQIKQKIIKYRHDTKRNIRMYDYNEYMHSCVLMTPFGDIISQGFYEEESIQVGNILEQPLEEIFQNQIFDQATHVLHYLQRRKDI